MKPLRFSSVVVAGLILAACGDDGGTTSTTTSGTGGAGGAVATTASTGGQGTGGTVLDGPGPGDACDVMAQNCADPSAAKCVLDFTDPALLPSTCEAALGTDGLGDACERPTEVPGLDTCGPGLYCSALGHPPTNPIERECRLLCDADADCAADQFCTRFNNGTIGPDTRLVGLCAPKCEFFDPATCPTPNTKCLTTVRITGDTAPTCFSAGQADLGETCATTNDCKALLGCNTASMTCVAFCDDTHGCAQYTACQVGPGQTIGVCNAAPAEWTCDPMQFADGTTCDCACGAQDPDCIDPMLPEAGCMGTDVCKNGHCVPPEWICFGTWYDSNDGCDCNCGIEDPDCLKPMMTTLGCAMGQTCVAGVCQ